MLNCIAFIAVGSRNCIAQALGQHSLEPSTLVESVAGLLQARQQGRCGLDGRWPDLGAAALAGAIAIGAAATQLRQPPLSKLEASAN